MNLQLYPFRRMGWLLWLIVWQSGCAGLTFQVADVAFDDAYAALSITEVEPAAAELKGVVLRLTPPPDGILNSREKTTMFVQIKDGRGQRTEFIRKQREEFSKGNLDDTYIVKASIDFEGQKGRIEKEYEMDARGSVIQLMEGYHKSKMGKIKFLDWKRTPVFPGEAVKIGDSWEYREALDMQIDSAFVKQVEAMPYILLAKSTLKGFARVNGRRTAVIETSATQTRQEKFKVMFKTLTMHIHAEIKEISYLDYEKGLIVARVTRSKSLSTSAEIGMSDVSQTQSIYQIAESTFDGPVPSPA